MPEETYAFRLRYIRSPRDTVNCFEKALPLSTTESSHQVVLKARDRDKTIEASSSLVLHGTGWHTPEEAECQGNFYANVLARTCARLRLGTDFGDRTAGKSWFTKAGLDTASKQIGHPVLNDIHGLMVYEETSHPKVMFGSLTGAVRRGVQLEQFLSVYDSALNRSRELSKQERAALVLFNSSFFPNSADGRLLLLMMAIEALIEQRPQSDGVVAVIKGFISTVEGAADLKDEEKSYLKSSLGYLKKESIRQAGRRLVKKKLGDRKYRGMSAGDFFDSCYSLRSYLVHGKVPLPTREEVDGTAATLEVMLSHLLSTDLLDVGPKDEGQ